ncbi:LCP family protein [Streptomyces sp. NPDC008343]|uniref:LCP family protein n=1 Tax=Streptomyces sp. NPDC008343 TaxID=3364828 RepID=UPI0036E8E6EB
MDAHGRGEADEIDPADQWVLNPQTGDYELRLNESAPQGKTSSSGATRSGRARRRHEAVNPGAGRGAAGGRRRPAAMGTEVPRQRRRSVDVPAARVSRHVGPRKPRSKAKKVLGWSGGILALLLVATAGAGYLYLEHLSSNLNSVPDDNAGTGGFSRDRPINILLIGTDKRIGAGNEKYGDKHSPGHADTTVLLHVSKDRTNATALSIPRDLITDVPDCPTAQDDGSTKTIVGERGVRFNVSLGQAGRTPSCTMRTVTKITGIRPDHFMVADFNAVKTLTSAVGGVPICLGKDIDDKESKLKLSAGEHNIEGEEALAFVRTRKSFGNKGDLDRIKSQQHFLSSLMRKLKSNDTLTSPTKLFKLAEAGTEALTVDSAISDIWKLRDLGLELGKFNMKNLTFATIPVLDNPTEKVKATVVLDKPKSDALFAMVRDDVSLTEVEQRKAATDKQAERLKGARADALEVRVDVFNGGAPPGSAQTTLDWLQNTEGVPHSTNKGNAPADVAKTQLEYAPNQADQARKLADLMGLTASALKPGTVDADPLKAMKLTLGADFLGAGVPISAPAKVPDGVQKVEADKKVCAK